MSRSGYSEDCENLELYRAVVDRALHGKRGQAFLIELAASMAAEISYENDECASPSELPSERWKRMRKWVSDNIATQTSND